MSEPYEQEVKDFLGPRGPLVKLLPRYEHRPEQEAMAAAVLRTLSSASILLVEAGTGTGKTLAYLVPALYSGERVVISTGTKALQEQLFNKDLPVLAKQFDVKAALMKGRANYLCWMRYHEFGQQPSFRFKEEIPIYERIQKWALTTQTGDRAEIQGLPDDYSGWHEVSATSEQCPGSKCAYANDCFITRMRARAQEADIVVVNHHLFFADLAVKKDAPAAILPSYHMVIFDEAHSLAEVATEFFGVQASNWRLEDLARDIKRLQRLARLPVAAIRSVIKALERAEFAGSSLFKAVSQSRGRDGESESARFSLEHILDEAAVVEEGEKAVGELKVLAKVLKDQGKVEESVAGLADRAASLASDLAFILAGDDPDHVFWAEARGRGVIMKASPAELEPILGPLLFEPEQPTIFTSATLAVQAGGKWDFGHFRAGIGLTDPPRPVAEVCLPSSYNFKEQAILYVPAAMPEPSSPDFIASAVDEMEAILNISRGRAFLLFTSYRNLTAAYERLADRLPYTVLKQGDAPKSEILEAFREDEGSVLFATASFWEGVDVSGQALSCVIIDKLPFASPGDPLVSSRIARIRRHQGNPFMDYQLPAAVIALKQGLGRLIRTRSDYGILAVLDNRLRTKRYGQTFLQSLPPMPLTGDLADLEAFLLRHDK